MSNKLLECQEQITFGNTSQIENNIKVFYESPYIDKKTRRSVRFGYDRDGISPLGNRQILTNSAIERAGQQEPVDLTDYDGGIAWSPPIIPLSGSDSNTGGRSRLEKLYIEMGIGPQNIGSLNVKINVENLKKTSNITNASIFASVWTDPGPSLSERVNGTENIEFIGNTDNLQYNEFTGDYSPPLTSDQLHWVELKDDGDIEPVEIDNGLRKTRVVQQLDDGNLVKTLSWIEAGEYDNSNGSIFSETLAMINSGLIWDQTSNSVDIRSNVQCYPPNDYPHEEKQEWCHKSRDPRVIGGVEVTDDFEEGMGCISTLDPPSGPVVNLAPCLENLDYADMNTTLKNGIVKTFVMFLTYGADIEEARTNFDFGCQTTLHIIVNSSECIKGWTGLNPDATLAISDLILRGETPGRSEPIELMQGCRVLGCLDPITGKYQTKESRPDFQNNPREYCEWLSMSAAQPSNIGDIDDTNHIISSIKSGLEENKGRSSIESNALKTNWNINTKMFRTTYAQADPCIISCGEDGCEPSQDCWSANDRTRGQSIISQIKDSNNVSPDGIDGPLGNLYGRKWLEITDNNCVYDSYVDDCVERRCGVGNQGENCTVPCCKGTCVYPERGGVANTASTNNETGWPLIQTSNVRDDYMPIPYDVGVDHSSWCKNEIGCEFYEGRDDDVNNIDAGDMDDVLIYNSGNGGSLEDGSDICTQCAGPPNWLEFNNRSSGSVLDIIGEGSVGGGVDGRSTVTSSGVLPGDINFSRGADYTGPQCDMRCCGAVCDPLGGNAMDQCSVQPVDSSLTRNYCQYFEEWNKCLEICQGNTSEECTDNRGCRWGIDPGNGTGSANLTACLPNLCSCENGIQSVGRNCALHGEIGCVVDQCDWGYKSVEMPRVDSVCSDAEKELNDGKCIHYEYYDCIETWWHKFGKWYIQSMDIENIGTSFFGNDTGGPVRTIVFLCILSSSLIALSGFLQILGSMSNQKILMKSAIPIAISFGMSLAIYFGPVLFYTHFWCGELAFGCDGDLPYGNAWTLLYKILLPVLIFFIILIIIKTLISIVSN